MISRLFPKRRKLTRGDVLSKLESVEFIARNSRECLRNGEAQRFDANIDFAIRTLREIEKGFDASTG